MSNKEVKILGIITDGSKFEKVGAIVIVGSGILFISILLGLLLFTLK